jgi:hypothetical protein
VEPLDRAELPLLALRQLDATELDARRRPRGDLRQEFEHERLG